MSSHSGLSFGIDEPSTVDTNSKTITQRETVLSMFSTEAHGENVKTRKQQGETHRYSNYQERS